jgi:hypothetical protein
VLRLEPAPPVRSPLQDRYIRSWRSLTRYRRSLPRHGFLFRYDGVLLHDFVAVMVIPLRIPQASTICPFCYSAGFVRTKLYLALNWILGAFPVVPSLLSLQPYRNSPPTVSEPKGFQIRLPAV